MVQECLTAPPGTVRLQRTVIASGLPAVLPPNEAQIEVGSLQFEFDASSVVQFDGAKQNEVLNRTEA